MRKLSTGADSTLGEWRKLVEATFGPGKALDYLDKKIEEQGEDQEVIVDERQGICMLFNMHMGGPYGELETGT